MFELTCYDGNGDTIHALTQWDLNQVIYIDNVGFTAAPIAYFNDNCEKHSYVVGTELVGNRVKIVIPNLLLQRYEPIIIGLCIYISSDNISRTKYFIKIPVRKTEMPDDYAYTENTEEITLSNMQLLINALDKKVEEMKITVDYELSESSENPVQNRIITTAINDKENKRYEVRISSNGDGSYSADKSYDEIRKNEIEKCNVWFILERNGAIGKAYLYSYKDDRTELVAYAVGILGTVKMEITDQNEIYVTTMNKPMNISIEDDNNGNISIINTF